MIREETTFGGFCFRASILNEVQDWEQVLVRLAELLREAGCVKTTYSQAVIERERDYPTGVQVDGPVNFALAHAFPEHSLMDGIAVGILPEAVYFHDMANPENMIPVGIVFMLAMVNPQKSISYIDKLLHGALLKPDVIAWMASQNDPEVIVAYLQNQVFGLAEQ